MSGLFTLFSRYNSSQSLSRSKIGPAFYSYDSSDAMALGSGSTASCRYVFNRERRAFLTRWFFFYPAVMTSTFEFGFFPPGEGRN